MPLLWGSVVPFFHLEEISVLANIYTTQWFFSLAMKDSPSKNSTYPFFFFLAMDRIPWNNETQNGPQNIKVSTLSDLITPPWNTQLWSTKIIIHNYKVAWVTLKTYLTYPTYSIWDFQGEHPNSLIQVCPTSLGLLNIQPVWKQYFCKFFSQILISNFNWSSILPSRG